MKYFCIRNRGNNVIGYGNVTKEITEDYQRQFHSTENIEAEEDVLDDNFEIIELLPVGESLVELSINSTDMVIDAYTEVLGEIKTGKDIIMMSVGEIEKFSIDRTAYRITRIPGALVFHEWDAEKQEYLQPGTFVPIKIML